MDAARAGAPTDDNPPARVPHREGWETSSSGRARSRRRHHRGRGRARRGAELPAGHHDQPPVAHGVHARPAERRNRRLSLHPGQSARVGQLLHRLEPLLPGERRGPSRHPVPGATGAGRGGRSGRRGRERLDLFRGDGTPGSQPGPHRRDTVAVGLGARPRRGRPSCGRRAAAPRGEPCRHADPLQPAAGRQAGTREARAPHRPRFDAAASDEPGA